MIRFSNNSRPSISLGLGRKPSNLSIRMLAAACLAMMTGCLAMDESPRIGSVDSALTSQNRLSANGLSMNGLSMNGLSMNGLSMNGLSMNGYDGTVWELNTSAAGDIANTESGREVLEYVARCALPAGDALRVTSDDQSWDFPGVLGLAPEWIDGPLSSDGKEIVSACLLAHVNALGLSVPISLRSSHLPPATGEETERYFYGEGTFYGDLYQEVPRMFSCQIRARDYRDPSTGTVVPASSPDVDSRLCADKDTAAECNMVYMGYCDEVCSVIERDGFQWTFGNCLGADGVRYENTMTVWLLGDGAESCTTAPTGFTCAPDALPAAPRTR